MEAWSIAQEWYLTGLVFSQSRKHNLLTYLLACFPIYLLTYLLTHSLHGAEYYFKADSHSACQKI